MNRSAALEEPDTLKARQNAFTRQLILDGALEELQEAPGVPLTVRAAAQRARLAERTVFRYFPNREDLIDAVAAEASRRLELPALPASAEDLPLMAGSLYRAYEAHGNLARAALQSELFDRIRESVARERWRAVKALVDAYAPECPERERMLAAANIRYLLAATSWHYYRTYFAFSLRDSIAAAELSIRQALQALRAAPAPKGRARG